MKSNHITMNYSAIGNVSIEINKIQESFKEEFKEIDALINKIDEKWTGDAKNEFMNAYRKIRPRLEAAGTNLKHYSTSIQKVVVLQHQTEQEAANSLSIQ